MDPLGRISAWLDSYRRSHVDPADQKMATEDSVRLTFSIGGRSVNFAIGRPGKTDETPRAAGVAEEIPMPDDKAPGDQSLRPQAPDEQPPAAKPCSAPQQGRTAPSEPRQQDPSGSFWDALDPTEREALRSVASWRTFAAGARLMEEGERADYVMVILGGQVKVRVDDNGGERVLAVRGLGQLVGERGALQVSVRSATVIAMDLIWALVIQTKDFAAFISAHPRVLALVQDQLYLRSTQQPAGRRNGYDPGGSRSGTAGGPAAAGLPDHDGAAGQPRRWPQPLNGENCTVFLTDVAGFGARTRNDNDRLLIREVLFRMTQAAVQGIPDARTEDRGDGFLTVVPPTVSTARVIDKLLKEFPAALEVHNATERESARFKLRLALNVGPVVSDMGVSGEAIIVAARLVEAPHFKTALIDSVASLGVIASPFVYETTIRHGVDPQDLASYCEVPVEVKESSTTAWMKLFDAPISSPLAAHPTSPEPHLDLLTAEMPAAVLTA
jgi:CRP-like cAMP-binding protein